MRSFVRLVSLFAVLSLAACGGATEGFNVVVTNVGSVATYLHAGDSSGILMGIEEEVNGEWTSLSTSLAGMCTRACSAPPGAITCADVAAELLVAHALLPGDSGTKSFDGEFWFLNEGLNCARRAPLSGPLRVTLCHDTDIVDFNGDPVEEPAESGPVGSASGEVMLAAATCETFELLVEDGVANVEIAE
ncbi:MAG: hypothetical protein KDA24_16330 [Deltaproteobacteria bacterium]|nr:hypothetical protein [Deltaproteobacteria bacterium]